MMFFWNGGIWTWQRCQIWIFNFNFIQIFLILKLPLAERAENPFWLNLFGNIFGIIVYPKIMLHNRRHAKGYMYRKTANAQMFIYYIRGGSKPKYQMLSVCKNKINALTFAQRLMAQTFKVLEIKSCVWGMFKVQLFWEGHKNLHNFVNVKTMRKIAQIFEAFSEKLNFMKHNLRFWLVGQFRIHEFLVLFITFWSSSSLDQGLCLD